MAASVVPRLNVDRTRKFTTRLQRAVLRCQLDPDRPVILEAHAEVDLEPVVSLARFLRGLGARNPLMLRVEDYRIAYGATADLE